MLFFVELTTPASNPGTVTATVVAYPTEAAFEAATNETAVRSGPNQNEFATRALAQAAADKYNGQPAGTRNVGSPAGAATAPSGTTTGVGFAVPSISSPWTHNIEQWLVRGFEMLLGAALIVIGLAKLASDTPLGKAALKIGTKAALL